MTIFSKTDAPTTTYVISDPCDLATYTQTGILRDGLFQLTLCAPANVTKLEVQVVDVHRISDTGTRYHLRAFVNNRTLPTTNLATAVTFDELRLVLETLKNAWGWL